MGKVEVLVEILVTFEIISYNNKIIFIFVEANYFKLRIKWLMKCRTDCSSFGTRGRQISL